MVKNCLVISLLALAGCTSSPATSPTPSPLSPSPSSSPVASSPTPRVSASEPRLVAVLKAAPGREFSRALKIHGPIRENEVAVLVEEASSGAPPRNLNAARLLGAARAPKASTALQKLGTTTEEVEIWSISADSFYLREDLKRGEMPKALLRADMSKKALESKQKSVFRTGFRTALRLKLPEAHDALPSAIKSEDGETAAMAIAALSPNQVKEQMAELLPALESTNHATFPSLALALLRTQDPQAQQAVLDAYPKQDSSCQCSFLNTAQEINEPWLFDFLLAQAKKGDKFGDEAYSVLVTQVAWEKARCRPALMELTLERLKKARQEKKRDHVAEELVTLALKGKNPSKLRPPENKLVKGAAAIERGQKWLDKHAPK